MPRDLAAPPAVDCHPLPPFADADLEAARAAFRDAVSIPLRQAWLDQAEPGFAPGTVRTGWRADTLVVLAELTDADIFTRATRHNERFWELGDTFELFVQPAAGQPYVELHVAPNNLHLQLRFAAPPPPAPGSGGDPFEAAVIRGADVFRSRTWVNPAAHEWSVLAEIPAASVDVTSTSAALAGSSWRFSFSRYDHTRGRESPVISSSSPHTEPRFHRPHEWGVLRFGV